MMDEKHLSTKSYYETLLTEEEKRNPVAALGNIFLEENQKEMGDLSSIRFAQGEVYYHNKDYEAAIFKWGNITDELESWAKKNVADAYFELDLLSTAVEAYKEIKTDNTILKTEIALKLFEIYLKEDKMDLAVKYIKQAIAINPDYQNITEAAQAFFEQQRDHENAMELAVQESIRTQDRYWFGVLIDYVEAGYIKSMEPDYFTEVLRIVYKVDPIRFEKLAAAIWKWYEPSPLYIKWIKLINKLVAEFDVRHSSSWKEMSKLYQTVFIESINGRFDWNEMIGFMPRLLTNWAMIARPAESLSANSALLAWNEFFPASIEKERQEEAEQAIWSDSSNPHLMEELVTLFGSIKEWAAGQNVEMDIKLQWFIQEVTDQSKHNILLTGVSETGKSAFINSVLGEELLLEPTKHAYRIQHGEKPHITVVSEEGMYSESEVIDLVQMINYDKQLHSKAIMNVELPSAVLERNHIALIDTPGFKGRREGLIVEEYFPLADCLLFILDAEDPFTEQERDILLKLKDKASDIPIVFVVTKLDAIYNKQEARRIVEDTYERIIQYEPEAQVIAYSSKYEVPGQRQAVMDLFTQIASMADHEERRVVKLKQVIKKAIGYLIEKRVEKENLLADSIAWNNDLVQKLKGSSQQVLEYEKDRAASIQNSFFAIKQKLKAEVETELPKLLKECAEMVKEDSDFRRIHLEINEAMNRKIQMYFDENIFPTFYEGMENWLVQAKIEMLESKSYLDDMAESLNKIYGENAVALEGDFRILDDWHRDISRMTAKVDIERENIFLRRTPSQLLLKGAGKIFGAIPQNKNMLYNQYKKFIENEDYTETVQTVLSKYMLPFDVFEKALDRDVRLFFNQPIDELNRKKTEAEAEIKSKEDLLRIMREKPEIYQNAVTLFELRLRQYEWMIMAAKQLNHV